MKRPQLPVETELKAAEMWHHMTEEQREAVRTRWGDMTEAEREAALIGLFPGAKEEGFDAHALSAYLLSAAGVKRERTHACADRRYGSQH